MSSQVSRLERIRTEQESRLQSLNAVWIFCDAYPAAITLTGSMRKVTRVSSGLWYGYTSTPR